MLETVADRFERGELKASRVRLRLLFLRSGFPWIGSSRGFGRIDEPKARLPPALPVIDGQVRQRRRPATVVELVEVQFGAFQVPVPLVAFGQAGDALPTGFQGLDKDLAIAADAQCDFRLSQIALGGVEILIEQLTLFPAALVALFQQRMIAQGRKGVAADSQFDFGFFVHDDEIKRLL